VSKVSLVVISCKVLPASRSLARPAALLFLFFSRSYASLYHHCPLLSRCSRVFSFFFFAPSLALRAPLLLGFVVVGSSSLFRSSHSALNKCVFLNIFLNLRALCPAFSYIFLREIGKNAIFLPGKKKLWQSSSQTEETLEQAEPAQSFSRRAS
jgi:hypothetical protein